MYVLRSLEKNIKKLLTFAVVVIVLLISSSSFTFGQVEGTNSDSHPMHWAKYWARAKLDRNLVNTEARNQGKFSGLRWPGSEGLNYLGSAHFLVAAYVTDMGAYQGKVVPETWDGTQFGIVSNAYLPHVSDHSVAQISSDGSHQQIWQPVPGWFNDTFFGFIWGINEDVNGDGELAPSEDVNFNGMLDFNLDPPESILKSMAISTDKRTWPEYWPGGSYIGDSRQPAGRPPRTSGGGERAGKWNGEYRASPIADQETVYLMDDHENDYWGDHRVQTYWPIKNPDGTPDTTKWDDPDPNNVSIRGMGVEVEARNYAWFHPLAEDILVSVYRVRNYSDYNLDRVVTGMQADANIVQGDFNLTDFVVAEFGVGDEGRLEFDILYQWLDAQIADQLDEYRKIGVFGFGFLESPGIDYNGEDDDEDGMTDESMSDGIDNDGDWEPFADVGILDLPGTAGNGIWDTEDVNLNGGLDAGEDVNLNDKLDYEPINDDRGSDGIGPDENGWPGPDANGSETNGIIDIGEPNYDVTDIDEADQAGLGHIYVYPENKTLKDQPDYWNKYLSQQVEPGEGIEDTEDNIHFFFGAKDVRLETTVALEQANRPVWKRFVIALLMGEDQGDIVRNKSTMQTIYNNNYRFLTPPLQPTLISSVTDRKVQLYWDTDAERSKDPFFGEDFNGYRLYKSTDPDFLDIKTITDAFGNVLLFEPLEIWDKKDGLKGAHPVPFPGLGVHYNMGDESGLRHSYTDTLVENGRTYYYALASIDAGNDFDFFDRNLITIDYPIQAMPSESPFNITVNELGEIVFRDINTAVCIPQESAAGYTEPYVDSLAIDHISGYARLGRKGRFNIEIFNKRTAKLHLDDVYQLSFKDDGWLTEKTPLYNWGSTTEMLCMNITTGDTLFDYTYAGPSVFYEEGYIDLERSIYQGIGFDFDLLVENEISASRDNHREITLIKYDDDGRETNEWKEWTTDTESNIRCKDIQIPGTGYYLPRDYDLVVYDHIVDTSYAPPSHPLIPDFLKKHPLKFAVWDVTDPNNKFKMKISVVYEKNALNGNHLPPEMYGEVWDSTRVILRFPKPDDYTGRDKFHSSWELRFFKPDFARKDTIVIPPSPGDVYSFRTLRNPTEQDTFQFTIDGGMWLAEDVETTGDKKIYVVPDPYVGASTLESIYELAGNSRRRVDFVNLPPKCSIYIFTASGKLVKKIEHDGALDEGRHPWDLTSEDGPEVAFGMYFFVVEAKGLETQRGKFAVIK